MRAYHDHSPVRARLRALVLFRQISIRVVPVMNEDVVVRDAGMAIQASDAFALLRSYALSGTLRSAKPDERPGGGIVFRLWN